MNYDKEFGSIELGMVRMKPGNVIVTRLHETMPESRENDNSPYGKLIRTMRRLDPASSLWIEVQQYEPDGPQTIIATQGCD